MLPRPLMLSRLAAVFAVFGCTVAGQAQIAAKSPFMAPQAAANNAPTAGAPLEFRALIETAEGVQFRLYDPAKKSGTWVKLNERNPELDVLAKQLDDGGKTLTVEHQGRTLTLAMREAKVVSSGSAAQAMPPPPQGVPMPAPAPNVAPAVTQAVVLNPTPADEQRRLEAVAAEVARRRALREQATQQIGQGAPQPMQQPQMQQQPMPVQPPRMPPPQQNFPGNRGPNQR